jgi:hypothetical protein
MAELLANGWGGEKKAIFSLHIIFIFGIIKIIL